MSRLRQKPRISYYEPEEPNLDEYVFCEKCGDYVFEYCAIHGALLVIPDDKVPPKSPYPAFVPRAALTVPRVFLHINYSSIPGAGLGVYTTLTLPRGVRFGPYRGVRTKEVTSDYSWQIYDRNNKPCHVVDAVDGNKSNWMRYVNCSRHWSEQNLVAFQYQGQLYYRTIKIIPRFTELMVFYGSEFANILDIDLGKYNSPKNYAQKFGARIPKKPQLDVNKEPKIIIASEEIKGKSKEEVKNQSAPTVDKKPSKRKGSHLQNTKDPALKKRKTEVGVKISKLLDNVPKHLEESKAKTLLSTEQKNKKPQKNKENVEKSAESRKPKTRKKFIVPSKLSIDTNAKLNLISNEITNPNVELIHPDNNTTLTKDNVPNLKTDFSDPSFKIVAAKTNNKNITNSEKILELKTSTVQSVAIKNCDDYKENILSKSNNLKVNQRLNKQIGIVKAHDLYYTCHICNYQSVSKDTLERHMNVHDKNRKFQCDTCLYRFATNVKLSRHISNRHRKESTKIHKCNVCEYTSSDAGDLKKHIRTHTGEKPFACDICDFKCCRKSSLKTHLMKHSGDKPYACSLCDYRSTGVGNLKKHIRTHTGEKPFACDICDFKCIQKSNLKTHLIKHSGDKPYACSLCDYRSTRASHLKTHIRTHTGEKPFACDICDFKCSQKGSLKTHLMKHSGDKPYACSLCDYRSTRASHLKTHIRTHTGEKPFAWTYAILNVVTKVV